MSIASELERIKSAKAAIRTAVNARGGTLSDELIDKYAEAIVDLPPAGMDDLEFFDWMSILEND